jgi:parallel beta-helix repeat protein
MIRKILIELEYFQNNINFQYGFNTWGLKFGDNGMKKLLVTIIITILLLQIIIMNISKVASGQDSKSTIIHTEILENKEYLRIEMEGVFSTELIELTNIPIMTTEFWVDDDYTNVSCGGHTWGVDAFNRIQAAIDTAAANQTSTINIQPGDYYERITIDKPVKLKGTDLGAGQFVSNISGENGDNWAVICVSANDMGIGDIKPDRDCFPAQGLQAYYTLKNLGYDDEHIILMLWHDDEFSIPKYNCEPNDDNDTLDEHISIYDGSNNWLFGPDGEPGVAGVDDDNNTLTDDLATVPGEYPPEFGWPGSDDPMIDVLNTNVTKGALEQQIMNLSNNVTPDDHVLFYFVNHGRKYGAPEKCHIYFEDDTNGTEGQYLDAETLDSWLDQIDCRRMTLLIDMCRTKNFIDSSSNITEESNRLIIGASSDINNIAHAWFNANSNHFAGSWFFHPFWELINASYSIQYAYQNALELSDRMAEAEKDAYQYPFMIDRIRDANENSFVPKDEEIINMLNVGDRAVEISNCLITGGKNNDTIGINLENQFVDLTQALVEETDFNYHNVTLNSTAADSLYFDFFPSNQSERNDSFMVGSPDIFSRIYVKLSPGGAGSGGAFILECATDRNNWTTLDIQSDTTNNLSQSGDILFIPPIEWAYQAHNNSRTLNQSKYGFWVRLRLIDKFNIIPKGDFIELSYFAKGSLIIKNNRIISNNYGIYLEALDTHIPNRSMISNCIIENNEIMSSNRYGAYIWQSKNNSIINNNFGSNNWSGIHLNNSISDHIIKNTCSNNGYGISILYASQSNLSGNTCTLNTRRGIYIGHSNNISITDNICNSNNWSGIHSYDTFMLTLNNNKCRKNDYGISQSNSYLNTIFDNTCNSNFKRGIYISNSNYITISNNNCSSNNWSSIRLWKSDKNIINNNLFNSNDYNGVTLNSSSDNIIENCSITSNPSYTFYITDDSQNNIAINSTFDRIYFNDDTSKLIVKNYLHVQIKDSNGDPIKDVDIKIRDNDKIQYATTGFGGYKPKSNAIGRLNWILITDRIYKGSIYPVQNITTVVVKFNDLVFWNNKRDADMFTSHFENFYPNTLPNKLVLESPFNNSYSNDSTPKLKWRPSMDNNNDSLNYYIQIDEFGGDWSSLVDSNITEFGALDWRIITPLQDGEYQWCACASDGYGNGTSSEIWNFKIDTTAPRSELNFPVNDWFYNSLNIINGSATELLNGTGIQKIEIIIKRLSDNYYWNGTQWTSLETWLDTTGGSDWSYDSNNVAWSSGIQYKVQSRAVDYAQNFENARKGNMFTIDMEKPKSIVEYPTNDTYLNDLSNISGSSIDFGGSQIENLEISIQRLDDGYYWDGSKWNSNEAWLSVKGIDPWFYNSTDIQWSTDSWYLIRSRATDFTGNIEQLSYGTIFLFDNTPPELSILINNGVEYTNTISALVKINSTDTGSGISVMALRIKGSDWSDWQTYISSIILDLPIIDGEKTISIRVKDNANNIATASDSIILDTTPPYALSVIINNGTSETNSTWVILNLSAIDTLSGVYQMTLSNDGTQWGPWQNFSNSIRFNLTPIDGNRTVYFKVIDSMGNLAEPISSAILLNRTKPPVNDTIEENKTTPEKVSPNMWYGISIAIIIVIIIIVIIGFLIRKREIFFNKLKKQDTQEKKQEASKKRKNEGKEEDKRENEVGEVDEN